MAESMTGGMKLRYSEGQIKRASIKPPAYITIVNKALNGEIFEDKFTLRGSLTSKSFKLFTKMQDHLNIKELKEEKGNDELDAEDIRKNLSEEDIDALLTLFPEFFMSLVIHADPETTLQDVHEFDTMLKLALLGLMITNMNIEQQVENATKK
ncbi:hypothetical protein LCGC14_2495580 [marine sediment metagenome]|uniref:Uncharacterized protein n=1 Tax=marine sediment metagenome TaxID=412755 RepID=A0A0F9B3D6_9ZZZZ